VTLYETTIPVFIRAFGNLTALLEKGRAYADEKGIPHADLLETRLYEDMGNLIFQVQRCSDTAKFGAVRLAEVDNVAMDDNEKSFDDLLARIAATVDFLKSVPAAAMDGREDAEVILTTPKQSFTFTGASYALHFVIPNFYFHLTTAYGLLRHKGVPLGKFDYLGRE
jgi:hypothetical protein